MDTSQSPAKSMAKRSNFGVNSAEDQNNNIPALMQEEGENSSKTKRFKQGVDPLLLKDVLEIVFSFLDVESIKNARQAVKSWSAEGAKALLAKSFIQIPSDLRVQDLSIESKEMKVFKAFLSHKYSDFSTIADITVGAFRDIEVWKSVGVVESKVKSVNLKFIDKEAELLVNLFDILPNINYLKLNNMGYKPKVIKRLISLMEEGERELVISGLMLCPTDQEELEDIKNFAYCYNIMLVDLTFNVWYLCGVQTSEAPLTHVLGKLLYTSRNVLKKLVLKKCELFLCGLEFPCMTALVEMNLFFGPTAYECKFASSFKFSEKVPNLQEFFIDYKSDRTNPIGVNFLENLFEEETGTATSVKRLRITERTWDFPIDAILKAFPNLEDLKVCVNRSSGPLFHSLWTHGKNIKKLEISIHFNQLTSSEGTYLNSIFTGFPPEAVDKIKKTPFVDLFTFEVEELRVNPSILDLKELEELTIQFNSHSIYEHPGLLAVSGKYAFKFLPKRPRILFLVKLLDLSLNPPKHRCFEILNLL